MPGMAVAHVSAGKILTKAFELVRRELGRCKVIRNLRKRITGNI